MIRPLPTRLRRLIDRLRQVLATRSWPMTSWPDFAATQPDLAHRVQRCLAIGKHATLGPELEFPADHL